MKTVQIDDETEYRGQTSELGDLKVGLMANASGDIAVGERLIAYIVLAGIADERFNGKITSIDKNELTVNNCQGAARSFLVDKGTRFARPTNELPAEMSSSSGWWC